MMYGIESQALNKIDDKGMEVMEMKTTRQVCADLLGQKKLWMRK